MRFYVEPKYNKNDNYRLSKNSRLRKKGMERGRKKCNECLKVDMEMLGLVKHDARNRDMWRNFTNENRPTLHGVKILWFFTGCVFVTLNVNDDVMMMSFLTMLYLKPICMFFLYYCPDWLYLCADTNANKLVMLVKLVTVMDTV